MSTAESQPLPQPRGGKRPFPLLRYFSIASLICTLITAVALGVLYRQHEVKELVQQTTRDSTTFAQVLSLTLRDEVSVLLRNVQSNLASSEATQRLDQSVRAKARAFNAAKVKIYGSDGTTVYSTQNDEIGQKHADNAGVVAALQGEVISGLVKRDQFNTFDRVVENRNLLQVYLPVEGEAPGKVIGVFEVYSDMTELFARIRAEERLIMAGVAGILLLLYGGLVAVVHWASRIVRKQDEELQEQVRVISQQNLTLEERVHERTGALEAANMELQTEIKERQAAERDLELAREHAWQQDKLAALGRLAAGIVHEVGNPLASVRGLFDDVRERLQDQSQPEVNAPLELIQQHIRRLEAITHDITEISIPTAGKPELINLNELLTRVTNVMGYDVKLKGIGLVLDLDHQLPAVSGIPDQLLQIFINLISNAADAIGRADGGGRNITVSSAQHDHHAVLTVSDQGDGMDGATVGTAFEPFQTIKSPGEGMGIGLSLCYSIVQKHGGEISIASQPQVGTTVTIKLPIPEKSFS